MQLFIAIWNWLFSRKPERSELLTQWNDPWFGHPGYKDLPPALLAEVGDPRLLHYPPYDYGYFGFLSGEYYMRTFQADLMNKLERQSGLSPEQFKNYLEPILLAYAELVHFLPASQHHHHNYMGGLIRHGLEAACFMLDWMVLTKFDHELTPADASMRLRRWYVAGIIAALFHDAGKAVTDVRVVSFEGDQEWFMGTKTIHEWAVENHLTRYFISWVKDRHEKHKHQSAALVSTLLTPEIRKWLIEGGRDIWEALLSATGDQPGPLTSAVKIADSRSVGFDRERCGNTGGDSLPSLEAPEGLEIFPGVLDELEPVSVMIGKPTEQSLPAEPEAIGEEHSPKQELAAPLTVPATFFGRLSDEQRNYLCTNPTLGSRLLSEFEQNSQIREVQNRAFLPLTLGITQADAPALANAGWLGPNLATTCDELTRVNRGETGVMLNTKISLIYSQLTNAKWSPRCHATLPDDLRLQMIKYAIALAPHANEEAGRGAKTYSLSFWARDKFQRAHGLTQDEVEQAILYGLEAIKISNERKYYFSADLEFEL